MNAPRLAKFIRKTGFFIAKLARPFTPECDSEKLARALIETLHWEDKLSDRTDREIGQIAARFYNFAFTTKEGALMSEIIDRLTRSPLGTNRLDARGERVFGIALNVRLVPNVVCDGCHSIGYACEKSRLCLYCLGLKVSVETRRQRLSQTLRGRFAVVATEIREKLRQFNEAKPS